MAWGVDTLGKEAPVVCSLGDCAVGVGGDWGTLETEKLTKI